MKLIRKKNNRFFVPNYLAIKISTLIPVIIGATAYTFLVSDVAASDTLINFSIQNGTLESALLSIAKQSHENISFNPELVTAYKSKKMTGKYSLDEIIKNQLQGTSLILKKTDNGTLTIVKNISLNYVNNGSDVNSAIENQQTLPTINVVDSSEQSEDESTFNPSMSSSATRTNLALQDTAQSIQVVSRKLLDERQTTDIEDALRNTGGVNISGSNRGVNSVDIRGFTVSTGSTDGVSNPSTSVSGNALGYSNVDGVERVEVLKGPQAVMAGNSSPAGSINLVRKAPTPYTIRTIKTEISKYGEIKAGVDISGPMSKDKSFEYRLNASSMTGSHNYPDFNGKHSDYVAPVISWHNKKTKVKLGLEFNSSRTSGPAGTVYSNGQIQHLKVYRLGDKDDHFSGNAKTVYYEANHSLNSNWSVNSKATYLNNTNNFKIHEVYTAMNDGTLMSHELANRQDIDSFSIQNDIQGKFNMGPIITHNILAGYDYQHVKTTSWDLFNGAITTSSNYNKPESLTFPNMPDPDYKSYQMWTVQKGLVLQDQIDIFKKLHIQLSTKRSEWYSKTLSYWVKKTTRSDAYQIKWVPNYGISYDISPSTTIYANLLNSYATSGSVNKKTGKQFSPSSGQSKEIGFKFSLLDDNLSLTTALFDIEQKNVIITDVAGQAIGAQGRKTKGYDVDLNGQILQGWNISASYTYSLPSDPDRTGITGYTNKVTGQPKHSGSIWTSYELQTGKLKGLGAGVGVDFASNTWNGSTGNYFKMGGWAETDASMFYHQSKYTITLGVKNIFNNTLYYYSTSPNYIGVKPNRTARLSLSYSF